MKLLTLNFLTCARKSCKQSQTSFPLHPKEAELEQIEAEMNPQFLRNMLPRLEWDALRTVAAELGLTSSLPASVPEAADLADDEGPVLRDLHSLLVETGIAAGKLVCGCCGHEYAVREGIANFLLPSHLV